MRINIYLYIRVIVGSATDGAEIKSKESGDRDSSGPEPSDEFADQDHSEEESSSTKPKLVRVVQRAGAGAEEGVPPASEQQRRPPSGSEGAAAGVGGIATIASTNVVVNPQMSPPDGGRSNFSMEGLGPSAGPLDVANKPLSIRYALSFTIIGFTYFSPILSRFFFKTTKQILSSELRFANFCSGSLFLCL